MTGLSGEKGSPLYRAERIGQDAERSVYTFCLRINAEMRCSC
jgi:hypothetical protein